MKIFTLILSLGFSMNLMSQYTEQQLFTLNKPIEVRLSKVDRHSLFANTQLIASTNSFETDLKLELPQDNTFQIQRSEASFGRKFWQGTLDNFGLVLPVGIAVMASFSVFGSDPNEDTYLIAALAASAFLSPALVCWGGPRDHDSGRFFPTFFASALGTGLIYLSVRQTVKNEKSAPIVIPIAFLIKPILTTNAYYRW